MMSALWLTYGICVNGYPTGTPDTVTDIKLAISGAIMKFQSEENQELSTTDLRAIRTALGGMEATKDDRPPYEIGYSVFRELEIKHNINE